MGMPILQYLAEPHLSGEDRPRRPAWPVELSSALRNSGRPRNGQGVGEPVRRNSNLVGIVGQRRGVLTRLDRHVVGGHALASARASWQILAAATLTRPGPGPGMRGVHAVAERLRERHRQHRQPHPAAPGPRARRGSSRRLEASTKPRRRQSWAGKTRRCGHYMDVSAGGVMSPNP